MNLWIAAAFFAIVLILGGASRSDALSTLFVRQAAIALGALALVRGAGTARMAPSVPAVLLGLLAIFMVLQLIPLPQTLWKLLPGRDIVARGAVLSDSANIWRPISMAPDRTINALFACLPPMAALAVLANLDDRQLRSITLISVAVFLTSGAIGFLQILSGENSSWYWYAITNRSSGVGSFANRNHQALALAQTLPLLAAIPFIFTRERDGSKQLSRLCLLAAGFVVPMIIVTGSRSGLFLLTASLATSAYLAYKNFYKVEKRKKGRPWLWLTATLLAIASVVGIISVSARNSAFTRLFSNDLSADQRFVLFWRLIEIAERHLPFGSGFGTFDPVFRIYEPHYNLSYQYFNHAHNDFIELVIEGGIASLLLVLAGLTWFFRRVVLVWSHQSNASNMILGRAASIAILLAVLGSIVDYPARTPSIASFAMLCCVLLTRANTKKWQPQVNGV